MLPPNDSHLSLWADSPFYGLLSPNPSLSILWNLIPSPPPLPSWPSSFPDVLGRIAVGRGYWGHHSSLLFCLFYTVFGAPAPMETPWDGWCVRFQVRIESCCLCSWIAWTCSRACCWNVKNEWQVTLMGFLQSQYSPEVLCICLSVVVGGNVHPVCLGLGQLHILVQFMITRYKRLLSKFNKSPWFFCD